MRTIVVDLEATCRESGMPRERMEIIEIGAVEMPDETAAPSRAFARFVRPVVEPILSEFCRELTGIRQTDVDAAETFPVVFAAFLAWIGPEPCVFGSWGDYDRRQLQQDCVRHGLPWPAALERHVNIKRAFAEKFGVRPMGMAQALQHVGLPLIGRHHRGIDDAHNIAALARLALQSV